MDRKKIPACRTEERVKRMEKVLRQRQNDLTLILSNIHDPHNVSAIYRSCDAFGIASVHLHYTSCPFPVLGSKSSASARKWVESIRYNDADELFDELKKSGFQILATGFSDNAHPLRSWDFLKPTAIILGNEHSGVESALTAKADGELYIPMHGMIQSFNVSVAAAIILAEAARQRELAGYYDRTEQGEENLRRHLQDWLRR